LEAFFTQPEAALEVIRMTAGELDSDVLFVPLNPYVTEAQDVFKKIMGKPMGAKRADIKEKPSRRRAKMYSLPITWTCVKRRARNSPTII